MEGGGGCIRICLFACFLVGWVRNSERGDGIKKRPRGRRFGRQADTFPRTARYRDGGSLAASSDTVGCSADGHRVPRTACCTCGADTASHRASRTARTPPRTDPHSESENICRGK